MPLPQGMQIPNLPWFQMIMRLILLPSHVCFYWLVHVDTKTLRTGQKLTNIRTKTGQNATNSLAKTGQKYPNIHIKTGQNATNSLAKTGQYLCWIRRMHNISADIPVLSVQGTACRQSDCRPGYWGLWLTATHKIPTFVVDLSIYALYNNFWRAALRIGNWWRAIEPMNIF